MIPKQGDRSEKEVSGQTESFLSSLVNKFKPANVGKMFSGGMANIADKFKGSKREKKESLKAKNPYFTSVSASNLQGVKVGDTLSDTFAKLYSLVKKEKEYDIKQSELKMDFAGGEELKDKKKHDELIDAFKKLQSKSEKKEQKKIEKDIEKETKKAEKEQKKVPSTDKPTGTTPAPKTEAKPTGTTPSTPSGSKPTGTTPAPKTEAKPPPKTETPTSKPAPKPTAEPAPKPTGKTAEPAPKTEVKPPPKTEAPASKPAAEPVKSSTPPSTPKVGTVAKVVAGAAAAGTLLMPSASIGAVIDKAAKTVGVDRGLMYAMANQESHFDPNAKPGTSSAKGIYQFIDSTWNEMVKKYGTTYPILKQKGADDPEASALAGALFIKENSDTLTKYKIPVNATNIYAAHFLGAGGAVKLLSSPGDRDASSILPKPAAANEYIFYKDKDKSQPRTVDEVKDVLFKKVGQYQEKYTQALNKVDTGQQLSDASTENKDLKKTSGNPTPVIVDQRSNNTVNGGNQNSQHVQTTDDTPVMLKQKGR